MKVHIKNREIEEYSSFKEEEDDDDEPTEDKSTKTDKIPKLCQTIVDDMKKFIAKNGGTHGMS